MATGGFRGQGTQVLRNGVLVAEIVNIDIGGRKADYDDATSMDSVGAFKEWIPALLESGELSFNGIFRGTADSSQAQLNDDFNTQTLITWSLILPSSKGNIGFQGFVSQFDLKIPHDKKVEFSAKIKITGGVTLS